MLSCKVDDYIINLNITGQVSIKTVKGRVAKIVNYDITNYVCFYENTIINKDAVISLDNLEKIFCNVY